MDLVGDLGFTTHARPVDDRLFYDHDSKGAAGFHQTAPVKDFNGDLGYYNRYKAGGFGLYRKSAPRDAVGWDEVYATQALHPSAQQFPVAAELGYVAKGHRGARRGKCVCVTFRS